MKSVAILGVVLLISSCIPENQQGLESSSEISSAVSTNGSSLDGSEGWYVFGPGVWERVAEDGSVQRVSRGWQGLAADLDAAREQLDSETERAIVEELEQRILVLEAMQAAFKDMNQSQETVTCGSTQWLLNATANCSYTYGGAYGRSKWGIGFGPRTPSQTYASARAFHDGTGPSQTDSGDSYNPAEASVSSWVSGSEICSSVGFASVAVPVCGDLYESLQVRCRCL